ncbi:MAG: SRPBCC family protein [Betaproteobacteria bacterium]|nr:MAG: SRPBCC family protein [Betaproteobacteria bacterium]
MAKIERTIEINAPVEKVFAYIAEPMSMLEYLPEMMEVKDVDLNEEGVGSRYRWSYKLAGIRFEGESVVTEFVPNRRRVSKTKRGIVSTWAWNFEASDSGTKLSLTVEYAIPVPVLGKLGEAFMLRQQEAMADLVMANIKARMER